MQLLQPTCTAPRVSDTLGMPALRVSAGQTVCHCSKLPCSAAARYPFFRGLPHALQYLESPPARLRMQAACLGSAPCQVRARLGVLCGHCVAACPLSGAQQAGTGSGSGRSHWRWHLLAAESGPLSCRCLQGNREGLEQAGGSCRITD